MAVCPFLRCVVATVVTLVRTQLHSLFRILQKQRKLLVRSQMSCLLLVNGLRSKSFFRVFKILWHVWPLLSALRNITRLEKNPKAVNLHPPSEPLAAALSWAEAVLRHWTLSLCPPIQRAQILTFPNSNPVSQPSTFMCVWKNKLCQVCSPRSCLPQGQILFAGKLWAVVLHWKEPSDSNFTIPCVCMLLPNSYPKNRLGDKVYSWKSLAYHITASCGLLLQWQGLLQSSGKDST